jgi:hypothetical protein
MPLWWFAFNRRGSSAERWPAGYSGPLAWLLSAIASSMITVGHVMKADAPGHRGPVAAACSARLIPRRAARVLLKCLNLVDGRRRPRSSRRCATFAGDSVAGATLRGPLPSQCEVCRTDRYRDDVEIETATNFGSPPWEQNVQPSARRFSCVTVGARAASRVKQR